MHLKALALRLNHQRLNLCSSALSIAAGINEMLERVAGEKGMKFEDFLAKLKKNNQWHVEVY